VIAGDQQFELWHELEKVLAHETRRDPIPAGRGGRQLSPHRAD